jgi:hypothetical protein
MAKNVQRLRTAIEEAYNKLCDERGFGSWDSPSGDEVAELVLNVLAKDIGEAFRELYF